MNRRKRSPSDTDVERQTTQEVAGSQAISRAAWSQRDHERGYKPAADGYRQDGGETLQRYPRVEDVDYFDQEASGRKQARLLAREISRRATWIDAKGQQHLNERLRTNNNDRRRLQLTLRQAVASNVRRTCDYNGWALAGLPDDPSPSPAEATGPITLVPNAEQRWSFQFNEPEEREVDEYLTALRSDMGMESRRPGQTATTASESANAEVCCPSERRVDTVGEGNPSPVAVVASSAPAHRRGASQPRPVPVFTGAPFGSSTGEGGFLVTPVPGSPRAGPPQSGPTAALESRKEGSDQGADISPAPDTAERSAEGSTSDADESHAEPTITTFEQFTAKHGSERDNEPTAVEADTSRDDMPHDPPEDSLPTDTYDETPLPTPHAFHPSHRRTGRRVVTVFSGYDGFREAACQAGSVWRAIAGCEDIHQNRKARVIAALWDDNNPRGKIVGDYADLVGGLESGALFFGTVDLWAITPPCWDHCSVNKERAGDNGKAGALIGDAIRLIKTIRKRHVIRGLMWEDVPSVADSESFKLLTASLAEPAMGLASTWAFVDVWRFGSPTRRKRVAVVAIATEALLNDGLETPIPGDDRVETSQRPPSAASTLLPPHAVPNELRIDAKFYEQLTPEHVQSSLPSVQVGKIIGHRLNSYVYDPVAGPVATIRANVFKAEGPGGNTGLVIDRIGPRRLAPEEATRIHGFDWNKLSHLEPHMVYHIIGNSVTVGMARAFLDYFDRNLD